MAKLLITGGAGFIGSHTCVVLLEAGHDLVVLDDFSNSSIRALDRVAELAGISESSSKQLVTVTGSINDSLGLAKVFSEAREAGQPIEGVIHFAGLKAVGESVAEPLRYWPGTKR